MTTRRPRADHGFTLVELMVVIVIIAALTAVAVPLLTRDDLVGKHRNFVRALALDLQRAKVEAVTTKEDRAVLLEKGKYTVNAVVPGTKAFSQLRAADVPNGVELRGIVNVTAEPGWSVTSPTAPPNEIRFSGTSAVSACSGASCTPSDSAVSIIIAIPNADSTLETVSRIVIYKSTGYIRVYDGLK